jgi:hypothetical protein
MIWDCSFDALEARQYRQIAMRPIVGLKSNCGVHFCAQALKTVDLFAAPEDKGNPMAVIAACNVTKAAGMTTIIHCRPHFSANTVPRFRYTLQQYWNLFKICIWLVCFSSLIAQRTYLYRYRPWQA